MADVSNQIGSSLHPSSWSRQQPLGNLSADPTAANMEHRVSTSRKATGSIDKSRSTTQGAGGRAGLSAEGPKSTEETSDLTARPAGPTLLALSIVDLLITYCSLQAAEVANSLLLIQALRKAKAGNAWRLLP
ncbi:uncharacterized protein O3C94_015297 isoform 2-T2 [Discoglossus pictus]